MEFRVWKKQLWFQTKSHLLLSQMVYIKGVLLSSKVAALSNKTVSEAYLVEELFARGAGLDGKLQLCVHGRDPHIVL